MNMAKLGIVLQAAKPFKNPENPMNTGFLSMHYANQRMDYVRIGTGIASLLNFGADQNPLCAQVNSGTSLSSDCMGGNYRNNFLKLSDEAKPTSSVEMPRNLAISSATYLTYAG